MRQPAKTSPETLTLAEAARRLGMDPRTARKAADRGEIPTFGIGRWRRVPRVWLEGKLAVRDFYPPATDSNAWREGERIEVAE